MSWAQRSPGISPPTHHQFLSAHIFGRIDGIDADIARHPRADRGASGPFMWKTISDTRVLSAEDLGAEDPGAHAGGVLNQKERSQPTPVAVARCGNRHVGGGRCASSRSIP